MKRPVKVAAMPPLPPVGGAPGSGMPPRQAQALLAAGRLLQSSGKRGWLDDGGKMRIERAPGETYPQTVARVVRALPPDERDRLRELVRWVMSFEDEE